MDSEGRLVDNLDMYIGEGNYVLVSSGSTDDGIRWAHVFVLGEDKEDRYYICNKNLYCLYTNSRVRANERLTDLGVPTGRVFYTDSQKQIQEYIDDTMSITRRMLR